MRQENPNQDNNVIEKKELNEAERSMLQKIESASSIKNLLDIYMANYKDNEFIQKAHRQKELSFYESAKRQKIDSILQSIDDADSLQKLQKIYRGKLGSNQLVKAAYGNKEKSFYEAAKRQKIDGILQAIDNAASLQKLQKVYRGKLAMNQSIKEAYRKKEVSFCEAKNKEKLQDITSKINAAKSTSSLRKIYNYNSKDIANKDMKKIYNDRLKALQKPVANEKKYKNEIRITQSKTTVTLAQILNFIKTSSSNEINQIQMAVGTRKSLLPGNKNVVGNNKQNL